MNEQDEVRRTYTVEMDVLTKHTFVVEDVNSPEEAEAVAEEWLDEGEAGDISDKEVFSCDAYPIDNKEDLN